MDKRPLKTRESTVQLMKLENTGSVDERSEVGSVVYLDELMSSGFVRFHCNCTQVKDNEQLVPSHIIITECYLYILRPLDGGTNKYVIKLRRKISTVMRIIKKAKMPDVIKIEYGSLGQDGMHITDTDKLHIPKKADAAIKCLKTLRSSPVLE